jgi:hypothetical protein
MRIETNLREIVSHRRVGGSLSDRLPPFRVKRHCDLQRYCPSASGIDKMYPMAS